MLGLPYLGRLEIVPQPILNKSKPLCLCSVAFLCLQWHSIREQRGTHKKGKEWRLVIHGPAKRWRMPSFSSVLLHIWCCYKTYTIKGLLLCPWCVVTGKPASPETQLYYYTYNFRVLTNLFKAKHEAFACIVLVRTSSVMFRITGLWSSGESMLWFCRTWRQYHLGMWSL